MIYAKFIRDEDGEETHLNRKGYLQEVDPKILKGSMCGESLAAIRAKYKITPPPASVPQEIEADQLLIQLGRGCAGVPPRTEADVMAVIAHLPEPTRTEAGIKFVKKTKFVITNSLLVDLAAALGYDGEKLKQFFIEASAT